MTKIRACALLAAMMILLWTPAGAAPAPQQIAWNNDQLKAAGLDIKELQLGVVSPDGNTLVCYDKEKDAKKIAAGKVFWLRIFHFDWTSGKGSVESVAVPGITRLENLAFSGDGRWLVIAGDYGTRFSAVDMSSPATSARLISQLKTGESGFRQIPSVFFLDKQGRICTVGYWVDATGTTTEDSVVAIDPQGTGAQAFTKLANVSKLVKAMNEYRRALWYAPDVAYFGAWRPDKQLHLYLFDGTEVLKHLDHMLELDSLAAGQDRLLYTAKDNATAKRRVMLHDNSSNKSIKLSAPNVELLRYPYISRDGSVILLSEIHFQPARMTVFYGREDTAWSLKPVPGLQNVMPGTIRFSPKGEVLAFFNPVGLQAVRLPR